jgi:Protein of unknown function (DUF3095)
MTPPSVDDLGAGFFAALPPLRRTHDAFDPTQYRAAPDDWALVVTDIVGSTQAIDDGRHKTVNFVAAMAIAALKNLCAPVPIPFLFGGDGAVVMVPPRHVAATRVALARVRGLAAREFGMALRVGLVPVAELRRCGVDVRVGRYEPSPGNHFGVFLGGGVGLLEAAVRGRGDVALRARATVDPALDDAEPVDLSGLSCRWAALRSQRGQMLTLILHGAADPAAHFGELMRLAAQDGDPRPVRADTLASHWPPEGLLLEARARRRRGLLAPMVLWVLLETLVARLVMARGRPIGNFDPARYRGEVATNTDFCRHDETLCFVIDCPQSCIGPVRAYLERGAAAGAFRYGIDVSDTALMTCLVTATAEGLHVHFVDGGGGGYTNAARVLKADARPT